MLVILVTSLTLGACSPSDYVAYLPKWNASYWRHLSRQTIRDPSARIYDVVASVYRESSLSGKLVADRILCKNGSQWLIYESDYVARPVVAQGDRFMRRGAAIYGQTTSGRWYNFDHPPKEFMTYLTELPHKARKDRTREYSSPKPEGYQSTKSPGLTISDHLLQTDGKYWYVKAPEGVTRKITQRSDRKEASPYWYARADSGHWFKFCNVSSQFVIYYGKLPRAGLLSMNDRLKLFPNSSDWLFEDVDGTLLRITHRGTTKPTDLSIKYFRDEKGRWHTVKAPRPIFLKWLEKMPYLKRKDELYEGFQLLRYEGGKHWKIRDRNHVSRNIVGRGDPTICWTAHISAVLCDNDKWYKIKSAPQEFKDFVAQLPAIPYVPYRRKKSR